MITLADPRLDGLGSALPGDGARPNKETQMTTAEALKRLMQIWDEVYAKVSAAHPDATKEEVYAITKAIMDKGLGLKR